MNKNILSLTISNYKGSFSKWITVLEGRVNNVLFQFKILNKI